MTKTTILSLILLSSTIGFSQTKLEIKTAHGHPMMYYISLPKNWSAGKTWPVVFILESADKEFEKNAQRFVDARGELSFILVAPINTNNGNQGRKDPAVFPYGKEAWDYIDRVGDCQFNAEGIRQIMLDVEKEFHAESKIFITGFEAGTHDLWSIVFNHPEYLKAAAPVAGNFRNRCTSAISSDPARKKLPIMAFSGEKDEAYGPTGPGYNQWADVKKLASSNGYENISETKLPGVGHVPLPGEVLNYFNSLLK